MTLPCVYHSPLICLLTLEFPLTHLEEQAKGVLCSICSIITRIMQDLMAEPLSHPSNTFQTPPYYDKKAIIVGIYGLPGAGKTFLMNQVKEELGDQRFTFYEGSAMISRLVPGGFDAFQKMEEEEKMQWRVRAIDQIKEHSAASGRSAIVTGHFMFWSEDEDVGQPVYTQRDMETFTHILYLEVPIALLAKRRLEDKEKSRQLVSNTQLRKWQHEERLQLRHLCRRNGILFNLIQPQATLLNKVLTLLIDFGRHNEEYNLWQAVNRLDDIVSPQNQLETVLVMDADRTLAAEDAGTLFWERSFNAMAMEDEASPLHALFNGPLGYSYTAFRQAMLMYEEVSDDAQFDCLCAEVASLVTMHTEFISLLRLAAEQHHLGVIVVTCGLRRVWEKVLMREHLSEKVKVIGGGRIADGFIVTPGVKAALVTRLQQVHHMTVHAFGDSPLDLLMLTKADQAIVVVGDVQTRSKSMDNALKKAIDEDGLRAWQVMLPSNASPRLDSEELITIKLTEPSVIDALFGSRFTNGGLEVVCATDRAAAKLLATPMRHSDVAGPDLRDAHRRVGYYLAVQDLVDVIGLEDSPIRHVLGHRTTGYRLRYEQQTTIVALMRGGEPMAFGVNEAFPQAMFVHASSAGQIKYHHLEKQLTVILVDSVINSGKTVIEFVQHVRQLHATIRIVIVAAVVQAQCVSGAGNLSQALSKYAKTHLVALRLSETKFTGSGTTDTGNRLFNTTHLP